MVKQTILCVDDEPDNLDALERLFRSKYSVLKALSGKEAIKILDRHPQPIALIVTDQKMPEMTGVDFLKISLDKDPDITKILLTGYTDIESIISAINSGEIYRYINKPWDPLDFVNTVDQGVEKYLMKKQIKAAALALEKAYKELKTLDEAKSNFMILINHELKTPLTSILSFTELLQESPTLDDEQKKCLNRIYKAGDKLKRIIDDVLLIVGFEMNVLKLKTQPFEMKRIELEFSSDIMKMKTNKNISIKTNWLDKKLVGDQAFVEKILARLIHNAIKYALENSEIMIKAEPLLAHRIKISVINNGPGIPDSMIEKIIKPFFLDEDVMNHSTGMGLGLSLCQALLKAHGSELKIENIAGGVSVSFELPYL